MNNYRGEIYNERDECIFSRKGNFNNEQEVLEALHMTVMMGDTPSSRDLIVEMSRGYRFKSLSSYYGDVSKLTYKIIPL